MLRQTAKLMVTVLSSVSIILSPLPLMAQDITLPEPDHAEAKAHLTGVFWQLEGMRDRVDDTAFDPDAVAYALRDDPAAIFRFMRQEVAYQPYPGLLRFGQGTLMNLAGNSCDQSVLLAEMLMSAGQTVRYATAPMTPEVQERLSQGFNRPSPALTAPAPFTLPDRDDRESLYWMGYSDDMIADHMAGAVLYSYGFSQELASGYQIATERLAPVLNWLSGVEAPGTPRQVTHCWVQVSDTGDWRDLDPAAWWVGAGERVLEPTETPDLLPLTMAPTVSLSLTMTRDGAEDVTLLDTASNLFRAVNELSLVFVPALIDPATPPEDGIGDIFSLEVSLNGHDARSLPFDLNGNAPPPVAEPGGDPVLGAADALNNLFGGSGAPAEEPTAGGGDLLGGGGLFGGGGGAPAPEPEPQVAAEPGALALDRLVLTITLSDMIGRSVTEERILVDRPEGLTSDQTRQELQQQMQTAYEAVIWGGRIEQDYVAARDLDALQDAQSIFEIMLDAQYGTEPDQPVNDVLSAVELPKTGLIDFARLRSALIELADAEDADHDAYVSFPQMIAQRTGFVPGADGLSRPVRVLDVVSNALEVTGEHAARARAEYGVTDTLVEYLASGGGDAQNFYRVLVAAGDQDVPMITLNPGAEPPAGLDDWSTQLLSADLARGYSVIAPERQVSINGEPVFNWLRINPVTGESLGRGPMGGQTMTETSITLQNAIDQHKAAFPYTLALCALFTYFSRDIGDVIVRLGGGTPGPAEQRSWRMAAVEFGACVLLSHASMAGVQGFQAFAAARGAAAAAGGAAGLGAASSAGRRPAPPVAARPSAGAAAPRPAARYANARPNAARPGQGASRPASGGARRPAGFDSRTSTIIDRPGHGVNAGSGTYVDGPGAAAPARPRPASPRTAGETFNAIADHLFGRGAHQNMPIARGRWESMTPAQREAARRTYRALRRADPAGNPREQFERVIEQGRDFTGTPAEQIAQGALDTTLSVRPGDRNPGVNLRELADAAGVTPQEMRQILDRQVAEAYPNGRRLEVGPDGQARVVQREPYFDRLDSHERQLAEMSPQDPRNAAENARIRAARDVERGLTVEESVAGQAHHDGVPVQEYLNRSGQTRAEGESYLANYLETQGLTPQEARAAARDYFRGGLESGTGPVEPQQPPGSDSPGDGGAAGGRGTPGSAPPERGARSPFDSIENPSGLTPEQVRQGVREAESIPVQPDQLSQLARDGETIRMTPEELRAVAAEHDTVSLTADQQRAIAEGAETVVMTPEQIRAVAERGGTVRLSPEELRALADGRDPVPITPEQQHQINDGHETVVLTEEQIRAAINEGGTQRLTREELQAAMQSGDTVRLTPEELRALSEGRDPMALSPDQQGAMHDSGVAPPEPPARRPATEPLRNPELPPEQRFQTEEAQIRANDPDGLLPAEREEMARLDQAIRENRNEFVPDELADTHLAERTLMEHQRSSVEARGQQFQQDLNLRLRQGSAPEHAIPANSPAAERPQPTLTSGRTPRRQFVQGDKNYLHNVMNGSRFEPTQNHVYAETINNNVNTILTENRFPLGFDGNPQQIHLLEVAPNRFVVQNGHHRVVSAEVASRLSGRPLLPRDAIGTGLEPIIPADRVVITQLGDRTTPPVRDPRAWRLLGVR